MEETTVERNPLSLALTGGVLGLLGALALGSIRFFGHDGPVTAIRLFGGTVFTLVYLSPFLMALLADRIPRSAVRGGLLMALGTVSLLASVSTLSLVTIILLPATAAIFVAGARSLRGPSSRLVIAVLFYGMGLIYGAVLVLSFMALFVLEADEARCWTLTRNDDGVEQWRSRPTVDGGGAIALGQGELRGTCSSDVVTVSEATKSVSILLVGAVLFVGTTRLRIARTKLT